MDINRLTEKAQEALREAQSEATRLGHQQFSIIELKPAWPPGDYLVRSSPVPVFVHH